MSVPGGETDTLRPIRIEFGVHWRSEAVYISRRTYTPEAYNGANIDYLKE